MSSEPKVEAVSPMRITRLGRCITSDPCQKTKLPKASSSCGERRAYSCLFWTKPVKGAHFWIHSNGWHWQQRFLAAWSPRQINGQWAISNLAIVKRIKKRLRYHQWPPRWLSLDWHNQASSLKILHNDFQTDFGWHWSSAPTSYWIALSVTSPSIAAHNYTN